MKYVPHFRMLMLAMMLSMAGIVGLASLASAHTITPQQQASYNQNHPCDTTLPTGIQMTSGSNVFWQPTTNLSVDPCTLYLIQKDHPDKVSVQTDGSLPDVVVPAFKLLVTSHAHDLWNKDLTCPHPENGVLMNVVTPPVWTLIFTLVDFYAALEALHPTIDCG